MYFVNGYRKELKGFFFFFGRWARLGLSLFLSLRFWACEKDKNFGFKRAKRLCFWGWERNNNVHSLKTAPFRRHFCKFANDFSVFVTITCTLYTCRLWCSFYEKICPAREKKTCGGRQRAWWRMRPRDTGAGLYKITETASTREKAASIKKVSISCAPSLRSLALPSVSEAYIPKPESPWFWTHPVRESCRTWDLTCLRSANSGPSLMSW